MTAIAYMTTPWNDMKTLFESDSTLVTYAHTTPYSTTHELVKVLKLEPTVSIELSTVLDGEFCTGIPEKIPRFTIQTHTGYTTEDQSKSDNLKIAGRVVELLEDMSNWDFTNGSYRVDVEVDFDYETLISNRDKISRTSQITADVYLRS